MLTIFSIAMSKDQSVTPPDTSSSTKPEEVQEVDVEKSKEPRKYKPGEKWKDQDIHEIPYKCVRAFAAI